ncbi:protein maestro-like [Pangshura tecta]
MAVRGLGNIVDGAPVKVKKHKKFLLDILIGALHDIFSSEVIGESMKALAKVLKELKEKDIGSSFKDLTQQIRTYFDDEDDALRSVAFVLFGILARMTTKKWKAYFAEQVRKSWVTLLLHLQDPSPKVSMECRATFHLCFPFLGLKRLRHAINKHLGSPECLGGGFVEIRYPHSWNTINEDTPFEITFAGVVWSLSYNEVITHPYPNYWII